MKKTLTSLLLLITLLAFSQKGTYGLATINPKQTVKENPTKAKIYQNNNSCFSGIKYKVKNAGKFTGDDKSYSWWIMFTNTYDKPVAFSYRLVVGGVQYAGGSFGRTYTLKPGESYTNDWGSLKAMLFASNSDKYEVEIGRAHV